MCVPHFGEANFCWNYHWRNILWYAGIFPCLFMLTLFVLYIILGFVIVLFFRCMGAILDPANRTRGGIKWGLVAHTLVMFSLVTTFTAIELNSQSPTYVGNRQSLYTSYSEFLVGQPAYFEWRTDDLTVNILFVSNNWLADGLLVSCSTSSPRCLTSLSRSFIVATSHIPRITGLLLSRS
jgi:hypothetical protein